MRIVGPVAISALLMFLPGRREHSVGNEIINYSTKPRAGTVAARKVMEIPLALGHLRAYPGQHIDVWKNGKEIVVGNLPILYLGDGYAIVRVGPGDSEKICLAQHTGLVTLEKSK